MQLDYKKTEILRELINIGIGKASATLNQLLACHVHLDVPNVIIMAISEYLSDKVKNQEIYSAVEMKFNGAFRGSTNLMFSQESAAQLVSALTGEEVSTHEMDEIKSGTLSEVGNILLNGVMGSISNIIHDHFDFSVVEYIEGNLVDLVNKSFSETDILVVAETSFEVPPLNIQGQINILMSLKSFEALEYAIEKVI